MTPFEEIEHDLDWREAEMAAFRIFLADTKVSEREKLVLFRAAWALLYAHFEGFCKFSLTVYYDELRRKGKICKDLPVKTQAFALGKSVKSIRSMPTEEFISCVKNFQVDFLESTAEFPEVDTESNLWPSTLSKLLECADITIETLESHKHAISTLVGRRNKIAHGERDIIPEFKYYITFENAVKSIMYDLAFAIDSKIS